MTSCHGLLRVCAVALLAFSGVLHAQAPAGQKFILSLESISRVSRTWMGTSPSAVQWSPDSKSLYFTWNPQLKDAGELYSVPSAGGEPVMVQAADRRLVPSATAHRNTDGSLWVYEKYGDLFLFDAKTGRVRQLTATEAPELSPRFTPDGKQFTFERDQNLFAWSIGSGEVRQITNFRTGRDPDEKPKQTKMQQYLEKQQVDLFEIIKKQERDAQDRKAREKAERSPAPEPTYLKESERVGDLALSGDGKWVSFVLTDRAPAQPAKVVEMPKYVTKSGFVETERLAFPESVGRTKVGDPILASRVGMVSAETGKVVWAEHGQGDRAVNFNPPVWSDDGTRVFTWAGSLDQKDAWLLLIDPATGKTRVVFADHDDAWLVGFRDGRGPGNMASGWMPDNQTIYFMSEKDTGYRHLFTVSSEGGPARRLTSGNHEVFSPTITRDGSRWYFISSEVHPGERHLYTMPAAGGTPVRLTPRQGWYDYFLSPDEKQIALLYGDATTPSELYVAPAGTGPLEPRRLTLSTTDEFRSYGWRAPDIVTFKDQDGFDVYADLLKPLKPRANGPAVIHVHGAGYAQGVYRRWSDTLMFFNYLAEHGYTVLNIDYRGSSGYGRDCGRAVYRSMGDKDILSAVAGAQYLVKQHRIDPKRIGIFGGSYGGFYTLMALFKHPGVFAAGAAMYPVTDWAHYNHGYTSRILNLAFDDDEAYRRSSPIYFADGLRDRLLILHGVVDSNVNFQDSVRLVQRLIELKKTGWDLAIYPVESHGWQQESSRLDSNRRIFDLFEKTLKAPRGPAGSN